MDIKIRKFNEDDIPYKVKWINDPSNNRYLHYDLPLREDKTLHWFNNIKENTDRLDCTILYNDKPVGLIGLLNIDFIKKDAEYYICLGENNLKGKGIATVATKLLINFAKSKLQLESIYLYTEVDNKIAQNLFEKNGFKQKKVIKKDLYYNEKYIDRYLYSLNVKDYLKDDEAKSIELN